jgi:hypothetical protein
MLACVAGVGWILSSCGSDSSGPTGRCLSVRPLAVVVAVRDSTTGQAAADGAIGTLVGSGVNDTLFHEDSLTIFGGDQLGTYTVTINRPGDLTWSASEVHVTEVGECGNVLPVQLSAKLQPAAS